MYFEKARVAVAIQVAQGDWGGAEHVACRQNNRVEQDRM
jgi:hypothetical protein